tara:strand:- start:407 stop:577 length:171 start_codon:yes stop_codon:yes gene_type:complete
MDGFDNLFSDESCVISETRISLFSLNEVKSYAEAWGGQGDEQEVVAMLVDRRTMLV